jgi:HNH endonuclease
VAFLFSAKPDAAQGGCSPNPHGEKNVSRKIASEEIATIIKDLATKLGHVPSVPELTRQTTVTRRKIRKHFGTYMHALRVCGLDRNGGGHKVGMDPLFRDWARAARELKKVPTITEYEQLSQYSMTPLKTRFGNWREIPKGLHQYVKERGWAEEYKDVLEIIEAHERQMGRAGLCSELAGPHAGPKVWANRPVYGQLMRPYPLTHGPTNEAGVIYLFGTMAEKLGFVVTRIQTAFPDCEAMKLIGEDRWQRVLIEFEYESRNFSKHMHAAHECDMIVCWIHNWPECPLEVVELKTEIQKL